MRQRPAARLLVWISRIASFSLGFFTPQAHWLGEVIGPRLAEA